VTDTGRAEQLSPAAPDDGLVIRRVTAADDPDALRRLRLEMLADTPVAFIERLTDAERRPPEYWRDRMLRYAVDPTRVMFVAEVDGRLVAQGCGYIDTNQVAHFVSVYVTPRMRGRRVVDLLAERVFGWARERGCAEIRLEVAAVNARAVAAYRRLGFELTGSSQPHPLYPEEGIEVEMARPL
jgi:ribosomal protein S18 acetylase RimI-like enzyme